MVAVNTDTAQMVIVKVKGKTEAIASMICETLVEVGSEKFREITDIESVTPPGKV